MATPSVTTQEIAKVAANLDGARINVETDTDWGVELVVQKLLRDRGIKHGSLNDTARLLGRASVMLDDEYDGNYNVYDKIIRAVALA